MGASRPGLSMKRSLSDSLPSSVPSFTPRRGKNDRDCLRISPADRPVSVWKIGVKVQTVPFLQLMHFISRPELDPPLKDKEKLLPIVAVKGHVFLVLSFKLDEKGLHTLFAFFVCEGFVGVASLGPSQSSRIQTFPLKSPNHDDPSIIRRFLEEESDVLFQSS